MTRLVGLAGCDKSLPGMMMAMVRLNVPSIFIYGGSILPGNFRGQVVTVQDMFEAVGKHSVGDDVGRGPRRAGAGRVPLGGRLRRAVHRQHDGDRLRGDRPRAALFGRRARALRDSRPILHGGGRADHGPDQAEPAPARHRHPQGAGKRRRDGRGLGRLDQCGAAPAGHRARMRDRVHAVRRGRSLQKDTVYRGFEAGRPLCRQRHVRGRRHTAPDEDAARSRLPAWRLHDRHGPHHRREPEVREVESQPGRRASGQQSDHRHRWRRRPEGESGSGRRDREGRRHEDSEVHRPGALLRRRGSLLRGGEEPRLQGRRRVRHPLRGPARRPRHARDALDHGGADRARAPAARSRSSPTAASPARRAASASAMSARRRRSADRSRCCATAT